MFYVLFIGSWLVDDVLQIQYGASNARENVWRDPCILYANMQILNIQQQRQRQSANEQLTSSSMFFYLQVKHNPPQERLEKICLTTARRTVHETNLPR